MKETFSIQGQVDADGNLLIINRAEMKDFMIRHKGEAILGMLTAYPTGKAHLGIVGYYKNKIVPDFQKAYKEVGELYTLEETDQKLRELTPITRDERLGTNGRYYFYIREIEELSQEELCALISHLKVIAAEYLHFAIMDGNELLNFVK